MEGKYEELSEAEQTLAAVRVRGDFVINSALDWIDRFHGECSADLISRLTQGIRSLSKAMHSRSANEITTSIEALLEIQVGLLLPGGQSQEGDGNTVGISLSSPDLLRSKHVRLRQLTVAGRYGGERCSIDFLMRSQ